MPSRNEPVRRENRWKQCMRIFVKVAVSNYKCPYPTYRLRKVKSRWVISNSLWPHGLYRPCNSLGQNTGVSSHSLLQGIFPSQVSHITGTFFTTEPPGKPKNTGEGSLSLLQRIFLTQESKRGLLHCRRVLYQLSHQGSPEVETTDVNINRQTFQNVMRF